MENFRQYQIMKNFIKNNKKSINLVVNINKEHKYRVV